MTLPYLTVKFPDIDIFALILKCIYDEGYCIARENENTIEILTKEEFIKILERSKEVK